MIGNDFMGEIIKLTSAFKSKCEQLLIDSNENREHYGNQSVETLNMEDSMKTKLMPITWAGGQSFAGSVCTGIILLVASSALAQNLFVSTYGTGRIYEFTPNGVQSTFVSGALTGAQGMAFNNSGNLFVANGHIISEFTPDGTRSIFASGLSIESSGMAFNSEGDLFVANNNVITEITPSGTQSTFASSFGAEFYGLAFNSAGDLFVADNGSALPKIDEFTPGGAQSTFAFLRGASNATGLAFNNTGDLFVSDQISGAIYELTPGGVRSTFAQHLGVPVGLAFDSSGNLFAGSLSQSIYEFTPDGVQSTFASVDFLSTWIAIQGVTVPVPEPSVLGLLSISVTTFLIRLRKLTA
jgi:hypothetical protein